MNVGMGRPQIAIQRRGELVNTETQTLSIISVSHRNLEGLNKTENSLRLLSGIEFEWIVVDTGFCEETKNWLRNLAPKFQFKYSCEPDKGIYDGMNKGVAMAVGRWLWFLNAGDMVSPKINRQSIDRLLECADAAQINFDFEIERDGSTYARRSKVPGWVWYAMPTSHQAMWFSRDAVKEGYDLSYPWAADHELTARLYAAGKDVETVHNVIALVEFEGTSRDNFDIYRYELALINRRTLRFGPAKAFGVLLLQLLAGWCATRLPGIYLMLNPSRFFK